MVVACQAGISVNGYFADSSYAFRKRQHVHEIAFHTVTASFPSAVSYEFLRLKESFPALVFDCVPLPVAYCRALSGVLKGKELFVIDIACDRTSLFVVREYAIGAFSSFAHSDEKDRERWNILFSQTLDDFFPAGGIPANVCVFGENQDIRLSSDFISRSLSDFSHEKTFTINRMRGSSFFGGESFHGALGEGDAPLAALLYYAVE